MKNLISKTNSIRLINLLILLSFVYNNILYYFLDRSHWVKLLLIFINILLLVIFIYINNKFFKEREEWNDNIKQLLEWNKLTDNIILNNPKYKENLDIFKIYKSFYIKKNLINKDYNDLKDVFWKFIPDKMFDEISKTGTDKISLWITIEKNLDIMFLDIIWFTTITEKLPPERALLLLNIYFDWIVEIIKNNNWYIDKFLWDWMMAVFEWDQSDYSIKAAIEIQNFISKFQVSEIGRKISVWIWINSWKAILWTIGSKKRMEITIIWDVVNTASRIESLTRVYENNIIISDSTYKKISNIKLFNITELWLKQLRGKKKKLKLYNINPIINLNL